MIKKFAKNALFFLCLVSILTSSANAQENAKESAYDRVIRTGTLRCGYVVWDPYLVKDPNTGNYSGIAYDIMQEVGKELNVKVEWAAETGWGTFQEGLNSNKFDMMCVPVWQSGQRAKAALLTRPVYFNALYAFAREDDTRFDREAEAINQPNVTVSVVDGDITQAVRAMLFPKTKELAALELTGSSSVLMDVATKKSDVGLENMVAINKFNLTSKTKLKVVANKKPLRLFGNVFATKRGEHDFQKMVDATIGALNSSGFLERVARKYAPEAIAIAPDYKLGD